MVLKKFKKKITRKFRKLLKYGKEILAAVRILTTDPSLKLLSQNQAHEIVNSNQFSSLELVENFVEDSSSLIKSDTKIIQLGTGQKIVILRPK